MPKNEILFDENGVLISDGGLWAGWNNEQGKGDDIPATPYNWGYNNWIKYTSTAKYPAPYVQPPTTAPIRNSLVTQSSLEKYLAQAGANQTPTTAPTTGAAAGGGLQQFFAENKYLVLGAAAVLAYFMFAGGGGSLAEKSVITRYNKR